MNLPILYRFNFRTQLWIAFCFCFFFEVIDYCFCSFTHWYKYWMGWKLYVYNLVYRKINNASGSNKKRDRSQESLTILWFGGNIYLGFEISTDGKSKPVRRKKVDGKISYANWHLCDKFKVSSRWEQGQLTESNYIRF